MRRLASLLVLSALALTACSSGSGGGTADTNGAPPSNIPAETPTPSETAPAATTADASASDPAAPTGVLAVTMIEWEIQTPAEIAAGTVTFEVTNGGSFAHHFAVARGESYETLPQIAGGAIDEAALGDDFLGRTVNLQGGQTESIEFDLDPGNYVLFCNIATTVSHAAQGQVLSVIVS